MPITALCHVSQFACESGDQCIHWSAYCEFVRYEPDDNDIEYEQCRDGSDERDCGE